MHAYRAGPTFRTFLATLAGLAAVAPLQAQQGRDFTDPDVRMAGFQRHRAMVETSPFHAPTWQYIGPTNISGRATDEVAVIPRGESYTIYIAGASGGVWKSENEAVTWEPLFDEQASTSIGDLALDPTNPDVVWVGTGEANIFRSSMAGSGIYKSTDGGETWSHMGLAGTHTIARIVVDPTNPDVVYVAAPGHEWTNNPERGVFKTTDGGRSWDKVLYVDDQTGAIDLVMDPTDPNTLYASTWQRIRKKWNDPRTEPGYTGSGIHKSTDGGRTWTPINEGLPDAAHRGRIGLALAASSPRVLYAFVDNYEIAREPEPGVTDAYGRPMQAVIRGATVFRSDDAGASWRRVSQLDRYMEGLSATYGWVFGQIRVDPTNPDKIYVMGLGLNVSEDGGRTFRELRGMHGDHHGLWIDPNNPDYLINNNDGGIYISYDGGENWRFAGSLPMAQFFNVAYDMAEPFHVYGSIQDHNSFRGVVDLSRGRSQVPAVDFESAPGGEGSIHATDPTHPATLYSAGFYGHMSRTDMDTGESTDIDPQAAPGEPPLRGQWLAPFILSPHNPRVVYHGKQYVFRSMDRGETWERISPDLTYDDPAKLGDIPYQTIFSLAESPFRFGLLYAGTDDGRVWRTRDGGGEWTELCEDLPHGKFIAEIVASKYDEGTVYLVQNGKRDDDFAPYVWKSTDYGETWTSLADGLPLGPVNVIKEDPEREGLLYVGTDVGAYVSLDDGATWQVLAGGLPSTFVHDLVVHPRDDMLVAATHGRGLWVLDVRPIRALTPQAMAEPVHVLEPDPAMVRQVRGYGAAPASADIYYWLADAGPVTVTVRTGGGETVRELQTTGMKGINRVEWDLTRGEAPAGGRGGYGRRAPTVDPGVYLLEVRRGGTSSRTVLQVSR